MTVDRTHVLATPGMDVHGSYVALSRHRDGMDLHYGRDDFASRDKLITTLSRDRAKDMATDYEQQIDPAQDYAERHGISFRARVAQIMRRLMPERVRDAVDGMLDRLHQLDNGASGRETGAGPERGPAGRKAQRQVEAGVKAAELDPQAAMRRAHTQALIRHARAVDAFLEEKRQGLVPSDDHWRDLTTAREAFNELRPHGWQDAETAYNKDNSLAREAASGRVARTIHAL